MRKALIAVLLLFAVIVLVGCSTQPQPAPQANPPDKVPIDQIPVVNNQPGVQPNPEQTNVTPPPAPSESFQGDVLAGTTDPYVTYNTNDFNKSLSDGRMILLVFYSSGSSKCKTEQVLAFNAFNAPDQMNYNNFIGFRVNFEDNANADDKAIAAQYNVTIPNTKVILRKGVIIMKDPDLWSQVDYVNKVGQAFGQSLN